ncbi:MAG: hypothetical protein U0792_04135 [Gemmataceae bacterium]
MSTAINDLATAALVSAAIYPDTKSSSPTSSALDMITADGPCFAIQQVGEFTADSLGGVIEESATGTGSWSAIDGAEFTEVTGANNLQVITFTRSARYLRYVGTLAGDTPSVEMAVLIGEQKKTL